MQHTASDRLAILSILVYNKDAVSPINTLLSTYSDDIVGRMGIPYAPKSVSVICIVLDTTNERIGALTGQLGRLEGVSVKVLYAKEQDLEELV